MKSKVDSLNREPISETLSVMIYYLIVTLCLFVLTILYCYAELLHYRILDTPFKFSVGVMSCGIASTLIYAGLSWVVKYLPPKNKQQKQGFYKLSNAETTMIAIVSCIHIYITIHKYTTEFSDLRLISSMLLSLPISKISFINSSPREILKECKIIILGSIQTWPFLIYASVHFCFLLLPKNQYVFANILLSLMTICVIIWYFIHKYTSTNGCDNISI